MRLWFWIGTHKKLCGLFAVGALLGCLREREVPVHSWWQERGSVMPHDTFPADCTLCHLGKDWHTLREKIDYDHEKETGFALLGAHQSALCLRCHNDRGPVEAFARRGCVGCHVDVHQGLLTQDCAACHDETNWKAKGAVADHSRTRFPLTGAHAATECWRCHPGANVGAFRGADTDCLSCHADELARVQSPDHTQQGWTHRCDRCHTSSGWDATGFSHSFFPLVGGHALQDCRVCHAGGQFQGESSRCESCHREEYENSANPPHLLFLMPTRCDQCHDAFGWQSFWQHPWPLIGNHSFLACLDCHLDAPQISTAGSCTHCHFHREEIMGNLHTGVRGYVWSNPACLACHPNGD